MNNYFKKVCKNLNLGELNKEVIQIYGGKTNRLFKVSTSKAEYAIKIISKSNIEKNQNLIKNIEMTEKISNIAKNNGVSVITAINFNKKYVQRIDDEYFLIYKWYEGDMLYNHKITIQNIKDLANELAKFHKIEPPKKGRIRKHEKINFKSYFYMLLEKNEEWSQYILNRFDSLLDVYNKSYESYLKLTNQKSFVHGDLNTKNILLVDDNIYMIDWETAKIGNPSLDFFYTSWFGIGDFDEKKYYNFCKVYLSSNHLKDDINISSYAALTEEFAWLELCIKRGLEIQTHNNYEIAIGKDSAVRSLNRILKCYEKIPKMLEIINSVKNKEY